MDGWRGRACGILAAAAVGLSPGPCPAQETGPHADEENAAIVVQPGLSLAAAVEAALPRAPGRAQVEAQANAAERYRRLSRSLLAAAPSVQLRRLDDRLMSRQGVSESEAGVELPLWRWGQRAAIGREADARRDTAERELQLHRWQTAGAVRERYWDVREAQEQLALAQRDLDAFRQLEQDVLRRIAAGDAAPAERLTAEGQRREREAAVHEAEVVVADRFFGWRALTGLDVLPADGVEETPGTETKAYPPLDAALAAAARADAAVAAMEAEGSGPPRLLVSLRADRQDQQPEINSLNAQLTIPLGGSRQRQVALLPLKLEAARAHDSVTQMQRESGLMHHEAEHELHARQVALADATARQALAVDEVALARRAYTLGEVSLAERLLTELRAAESTRTRQLAVIGLARATARFNQINGVPP